MCYNGKSVEYVIINCSGIQLYDGTRPKHRTECDTIALGVRLLSPHQLVTYWCPAVLFLLHDTGVLKLLTIPLSELLSYCSPSPGWCHGIDEGE